MTTVPRHAPPAPPPVGPRRGPEPFVDGNATAGWFNRVLAVLLDSALVASVAWLVTSDAPSFAALPLLTGDDGPPPGDDTVAWTVGMLLGIGILQAYTGMTPGKRVTGVAVVDAGSGRPIGLLGTVLRWLAHFLDAFLMLGYLRAAWHPRGRTFADSLLGTVVVLSTRPRPHRWVQWLRGHRDARAPWLRWPRLVTSAVALVVCAASAAMSLVQGSGSSTVAQAETSCTSTGDLAATAMVGSAVSTRWESRLGIERPGVESSQLVVGWSTGLGLDGGPAPDAAEATLTVRSPDGQVYSSLDGAPSADQGTAAGWNPDHMSSGGSEEPWWTVPDLVASAGLEAPEDVSGWTARAVLLDGGGAVVADCSVPVPTTPSGSGAGAV